MDLVTVLTFIDRFHDKHTRGCGVTRLRPNVPPRTLAYA
jgi:hypothetical protein